MGFYNNRGVEDSKLTRQIIVEKANLMLNSLLSTMGSTYVSSNSFSVFAVQLKSLCFEAARVITNAEDVYNDLIFTTTRPEFLFQNLESYLFFNQAFPFANKDDVAVKNFLLALIKAYFNGATKRSIIAALELASENQARVELEELFLGGREADGVTDTVPLSHTFLVSIFVENSSLDVVQLQSSINFLTDLIKPAHTALNTRFVFQEDSQGWGGACIFVIDPVTNLPLITTDGFEVTQKTKDTQICDVFNIKIFNYGYEDLRDNCFSSTEKSIVNEPAFIVDQNTLHTRFGPLGNGSNGILESVNQVTVLINGSPVIVESVNALKGIIKTLDLIPEGASVSVSYTYLRRHFEYFTLNNPNTVLSQFDPYNDTLPTFRYSSVIWSPTIEIPDKTPVNCDYRYSGYDGLNSSLLNDISTLAFNRLGTARDKLNDYTVFKSDKYDEQPIYNLNYGVPIFILKQEKTLINPDDSRSVFKLNDPFSKLNSLIYNIVGGTTAHQVSSNGTRKIYADLEIEATCYGTVTDRLKPMCEDGLDLFFDFANNSSQESYSGIKPSVDEILSTNNTGFVLNRFVLYVPRTGFDVSYSRIDLHDTQIEEPVEKFVETPSGFHQMINWLELDYQTKVDRYFHTNENVLNDNSPESYLPPFPKFEVDDEYRLDYALNDFDDFFVARFCLNDKRSNLNSTDGHSIIRSRPGTTCDSYISDYLAYFEYIRDFEQTLFEIFDPPEESLTQFNYGLLALEEPISAFNDILSFNINILDNKELFPVSGVLDQLNVGLNDLDNYNATGNITDTTSTAISGRFADGFIHGHVVLFPYFLASFAPIYDMIAPSGYSIAMGQSGGFNENIPQPDEDYVKEDLITTIVNFEDGFIRGDVVLYPYFLASFAPIFAMIPPSGYGINMGQGGGLSEVFPPIQDLYLNNLNPVFLDKIPKIIEDLKQMKMSDGEITTYNTSDAELNTLDYLATKFDLTNSGYNFAEISEKLREFDENGNDFDEWFEPSGNLSDNFSLIS
jgi:hypothetical protein